MKCSREALSTGSLYHVIASLLALGSTGFAAPSRRVCFPWAVACAASVLDYSGGPATDLHRVPFYCDEGNVTLARLSGNSLHFSDMKELILGGARSGKSSLAEIRAVESGLNVIYIATAEPNDDEMTHRVAHHRARRPISWSCVEESLRLAETLERLAAPDTCLLVDCLTLWLSNLFFAGEAAAQCEANREIDCALLRNEINALYNTLPRLKGRIILVSNEVGWSIVPMNPVARLFTDEQGRLNQRVAEVCQRVTLVAAGLPLALK